MRRVYSGDVAFGLAPYEMLWPALAIVVLLGIVLWIVVANSGLTREDDSVDRPSRIAQLYGYAVCLVAVITMLISSSSVVSDLFTLMNPTSALATERFGFGASLVSYESFKATYERERSMGMSSGTAKPDSLPESAMRSRYDALRADRLTASHFDAEKSLLTSGILLAFAIALFAAHWRWLRGLRESAAAP